LERLVLEADLKDFSVDSQSSAVFAELPVTGSSRWTTTHRVGWWLIATGSLAMAMLGMSRSRRTQKVSRQTRGGNSDI
jgi:hypothetical protein